MSNAAEQTTQQWSAEDDYFPTPEAEAEPTELEQIAAELEAEDAPPWDEETGETPQAAEPISEPVPPERDFVKEVQQLKALYPDFREMPDTVARAVADGTNLLTAYVAYREQQTRQTAETLEKENAVLRQNAAAAAKAPVRGVTGGGAADTKPRNNLLVGFDEDRL